MSRCHSEMLQDGTVWTKLPWCNTWLPAAVGAGGFPSPPGGKAEPRTPPPDSVQSLQELPHVWGQGTAQPCH